MQYLVDNLEFLCNEVFYLHNELHCAKEVKARDNFVLGLLESEHDSARAQLSLAQG